MKEFAVSGHSGTTTETFIIPNQITIVFYAENGQTCYVPENEESLDIVIGGMRHQIKDRHHAGEQIGDYEIFFDESPFQGLCEVGPDHRCYFYQLYGQHVRLRHMCSMLQEHVTGPITLYCIFCRGSTREFEAYDFGMDDIDVDMLHDAFADEPTQSPPSNSSSSSHSNSNPLDSFDLNFSYLGGKKRRKTRKRKRKTNTRKNKRRTKSKKYIV